MVVLLLSLLAYAPAKPTPPARVSPPRVYIPEDSDPCDFERFKSDSYIHEWVRQTSPNTARSARCYHTPAKLLPALSDILKDIDRGALDLDGGAKVDLRAAALTGYQVDAMIDVNRDGKRYVGLILKNGINGPAASQVYVAR